VQAVQTSASVIEELGLEEPNGHFNRGRSGFQSSLERPVLSRNGEISSLNVQGQTSVVRLFGVLL
jgi:hypothetical protein